MALGTLAAISIGAGVAASGAAGGIAQGIAAGDAASAQERASLAGVEEQRRQFDKFQEVLGPYVAAGGQGLGELGALLGLPQTTTRYERISGAGTPIAGLPTAGLPTAGAASDEGLRARIEERFPGGLTPEGEALLASRQSGAQPVAPTGLPQGIEGSRQFGLHDPRAQELLAQNREGGRTGLPGFVTEVQEQALARAEALGIPIEEIPLHAEELGLSDVSPELMNEMFGLRTVRETISGDERQRQAIQGIEQGAEFQSLFKQGEDAILSNASATGGLRGGNVQGALGQYRPQLLNQLINQKFQRLSGLASLGQASAAGVGQAGLQTGAGISQQHQLAGQAQAQRSLATGQAISGGIGALGQGLGIGIGLSKF